MRIAAFEHLHADAGWRVFSFLKIVTDDGLVGWSEYNEGYGAGGVTMLLRKFFPLVKGMDPREVGKISVTLHAITRLAHGGLNAQAIAVIQNACLDIKAKALGVPVCALFGGPLRERVPLYWSHCGSRRVWRRDLFEDKWGFAPVQTLDDVTRIGREAVERGFAAVKTNPFDLMAGWTKFSSGFRMMPGFLDRNPDMKAIGEMKSIVAAFREGLGPDAGLMLDLNFNQRTEGFLRIARALEEDNLTWLEIDMRDPEALAHIRKSTRTPIASLEAAHGLHEYRHFFAHGAVDVAIIDVHWNGVWDSVRIATLADAYEVQVAPHNYSGHLSNMMAAQFCAAVPNIRIMEIDIDDVPWKDDLVTRAPVIADGHIHVEDAPGWGTDVNEDAVKEHPAKAEF